MSDENNINNEAKNEDTAVEPASVLSENQPEEIQDDASLPVKSLADDDDEPRERKPSKNVGLVDLPESVRIKLEKQKEARLKKAKKRKSKKKQLDRKVPSGRAYIKSTYNNTIITLTDANGNVLSWASAGIAGFKGPKKATPYAAQVITRIAVERAREAYKLEEVAVFVRGVGTGREAAVRALNANGLHITALKDITPVPHNGCRAKKPRRV
jgi:small subunit ribosomal protein S11